MDSITIKQGSNSPLQENLLGIKWPGDGYMAPGKEALQTKLLILYPQRSQISTFHVIRILRAWVACYVKHFHKW